MAGEARRAVWKPKLDWNATIVVDAGICQFMTSDVTQWDFGHNFGIFVIKLHLPSYLLSRPN